jgi:Hg(II)-responsive transcriptional regulator
MRIGEVAAEARVGVQTLRYYERRGLLPRPRRQSSGQRTYEAGAVQRVRFIKRAQDLGFTLDEIDALLGLWADSAKSCQAVENRAAETLERINAKIRDLRQMQRALAQYVTACRDRHALDECPLLEALGGLDVRADK